jgi:hypothetical protein
MTRACCVALLLSSVLACSKKETWRGWVYPKGQTLNSRFVGQFDSKEECIRAVEEGSKKGDDYECGKNCKPGPGGPGGPEICEETADAL